MESVRSTFSYTWGLPFGTATIGYITDVDTYILVIPLRSPMSIFSKSLDLEKDEAGKPRKE